MRKAVVFALLVIAMTVIIALQFNASHQSNEASATPVAEDPGVLTLHFRDRVLDRSKLFPGYDSLGLGGGADGFLLLKVYPGLLPQDFTGVSAIQGDYSIMEGKLYFTGNAASNSAVLGDKGFRRLMENTAARYHIVLLSRSDVDELITRLEAK